MYSDVGAGANGRDAEPRRFGGRTGGRAAAAVLLARQVCGWWRAGGANGCKRPATDCRTGTQGLSSGLTRGSASNSGKRIFFAQPCSKSGDDAGGTAVLARGHPRRDPGSDAAARHDRDRAAVRLERGQPGRLLPSLASLGTSPGRDGAARRDPASEPGQTATTPFGGSRCC